MTSQADAGDPCGESGARRLTASDSAPCRRRVAVTGVFLAILTAAAVGLGVGLSSQPPPPGSGPRTVSLVTMSLRQVRARARARSLAPRGAAHFARACRRAS